VKDEELHGVLRKKGIFYRQCNERRQTGYILRRNCLLKHIIERNREGRIEMAGKEE
jgi:hypothetical protein